MQCVLRTWRWTIRTQQFPIWLEAESLKGCQHVYWAIITKGDLGLTNSWLQPLALHCCIMYSYHIHIRSWYSYCRHIKETYYYIWAILRHDNDINSGCNISWSMQMGLVSESVKRWLKLKSAHKFVKLIVHDSSHLQRIMVIIGRSNLHEV